MNGIKGPTRKPVCICNAQYRWQQELLLKKASVQDQSSATEAAKQAKEEESERGQPQDGSRSVGTHLAFINYNDNESPLLLSKKHGSLDRLLHLTQINSNCQKQSDHLQEYAKDARPRHERLARKVKSTESAIPPSTYPVTGTGPPATTEALTGSSGRAYKMDANQLEQLQYLQRGPYPIPQPQQQPPHSALQAQHQVSLQSSTANHQHGSGSNANDEFNRKLLYQQQQKRLESNVSACPQTLANNNAPVAATDQRRHQHDSNQYPPQCSSGNLPQATHTLVHPKIAVAGKKQPAANAKDIVPNNNSVAFLGQRPARELVHGKCVEVTEKKEKKIVWSNHNHSSSANGSSAAHQNFQLHKNPSYPSLQQYYIHPQSKVSTSDISNRNYPQAASSAVAIDNKGPEWFERSQRQRLSSRSVGEAENIIYQTIGIPPANGCLPKVDAARAGHHRHSSGPSEMSLLKEDIAKLLSQLSLDVSKKGSREPGSSGDPRRSVEFIVKDDSSLYFKRPVQRQSSGPSDVTALRNDLIQWLTWQQASMGKKSVDTFAKNQIVNKEDLYAKVIKPQQNSGISSIAASQVQAVSQPPIPKPRKRHSIGHDGVGHDGRLRKQSPQTVVQKFEIPKEMLAQLELNANFVDLQQLRRPSKSSSHADGGKMLRHSASEVVTTSTSNQLNSSAYANSNRHSSRSGSKSKRHQTQRSATVSEMVLPSATLGRQSTSTDREGSRSIKKQSVQRRSSSSISSLPKCTDPNCPLLPICTDPDCCYLANCNDRIRYTQHIPRCRCKKCTPKCSEYRCNSLPRCMDSKCPATSASTEPSLIKCNSLPRCAESSTSSFVHNNYLQDNCAEFPLVPQNNSQRRYNGSRSSLPREHSSRSLSNGHTAKGRQHHRPANKTEHGGALYISQNNGKLVKSVSAASLNSRRRRHKTVHFGDNLLREVCQNRKFMKSEYVNVPATSSVASVAGCGTANPSAPLQPNIEMLYNFIEGVLSSWVDEDYDDLDGDPMGGSTSLSRWTGAESDPERGGVLKPVHRCNRARIQTIRRVVGEAAQLKGSAKLGNQRYRHRHWRGTAKDCNERFLRKVTDQN